MSLVLVILGLVIAGVFAGNTLIQSARIRETVAQKERFDASAMTFISKYKGVPGDIRNYRIFGGVARAGTNARGDGDWLVEKSTGYSDEVRECGENLLFWRDLSDAGGLQDIQSLGTDGSGSTCIPAAVTPETGLGSYLPRSPWGRNTVWLLQSGESAYINSTIEAQDPRRHYYDLVGAGSLGVDGKLSGNNDFIPADAAQMIDAKADDGLPLTGRIRAINITDGTYDYIRDPSAVCAVDGQYVAVNSGFCSMRFDVRF